MAQDELIAFLNELLEAERAGARVTLESARAAGSGPIARLMSDIQRDEARWCAMLARYLKAVGVTPSVRVGAFYEKAIAITDLSERIAFLNRGQGWSSASCTRPCREYATVTSTRILQKCCDRTNAIFVLRTRPCPLDVAKR